MPQDTTFTPNDLPDTGARPDSIHDALRVAAPSPAHGSVSTSSSIPHHTSGNALPRYSISIFFIVIALFLLLKYWRYRYLNNKLSRIYANNKQAYDDMLSRYNPYYKSLGPENRDRFIRRLIFFMESKDFEYVDMQQEPQMPVLISAAAIQLTFGLGHYLLDYFQTIYVLKNDYRYANSTVPFEGNVSEEGIYLSWDNFIREYADYTDGQNVGLHEMAHALTYVNFTVQDGMDDSFRKKFYEFSPVARPVFERMQAGETNLLGRYAATNFQEFWAVCIESFFERPFPFREQLPQLYSALCRLLNQDPLTPNKILTPVS